ncbi:MAG: GTP 3',8-cyclase MoaA [Candidatus Zixiibacteriota bacterium]
MITGQTISPSSRIGTDRGGHVMVRPEEPLTDPFGRTHTYLRVSVTDRCNLRCFYCMPRAGIAHRDRDEILTFDEIVRLARLFARMGTNKIRLTGGEPLARRGIEDLIVALAGISGIETLGMTTNGLLLADRAHGLRRAGLTHLNVSLDTLRPERFARIALREGHAQVPAGIVAALDAGFVPLKLNMVVLGGINDDEVLDFVALTRSRPIHVRFIEFMPFRANGWEGARFVPAAALQRRIRERFPLIPTMADESHPPVAREFRIDGHQGTVGFIASMSDHFCVGCRRLRLTSDGSLKTCLFFPAEVSLRDEMRAGASDGDLMCLIRRTVQGKRLAHPPLEELQNADTQSMIEIGG